MESKLFTPYKLGPVTLHNRTIRSAAFESMGKDFGPTEQLKQYHVSVARGGIGMTTLAYAAVCRSGLSFNKQLWLRPAIVPALHDITDAIHAEGAAAGIQIGHCGNMTHYSTAGQIPIGASTGFNLYAYTPVRGMRRSEIEEVARDFGRAVHTAADAGFDSVEVHAGHGYLISQFLSPYTNHRRDEYGGSLDNRMRFMRMCLTEVMEAAARRNMAVLVKHNMYDGFKGGIEIPESIEIAREIERFGVNGIVLSGGFVSKAPMAVMRGLIPIYTMSYYSPWWLRYFIRWCGPFMIRQYPFEECYFLEDARKFRYSHLSGALTFIPYGTMVDHFQHIVFEKPDMTPRERHDTWKELLGIYMPWMKLDGDIPFYSEGEGWQRQHHIYSMPFYYIDYCLAQTVALQIWALQQKDRKNAWEHYMAYTRQGGSRVFTELLKNAGLESPFEESCLNGVCQTASEWLKSYDLTGIE